MATAFGIDPIFNAAGAPVAGTSSQDIRHGLMDGLFDSQGVIYGLTVTPSKTDMTYSIAPGAAVIATGDGNVIAPGYKGTATTVSPNVATRHWVCMRQNVTATNVEITYEVRTSEPNYGKGDRNIIHIAAFDVPKGATNLSQAKLVSGKTNAATWRNSVGRVLFDDTLPKTGFIKNNTNNLTITANIGSFPTNRRLRVDIGYNVDKQTKKEGAVDQNEACYVSLIVNGATVRSFSTGMLDNTWERDGAFYYYVNVPANTKTTISAVWKTGSNVGNKKSYIYLRDNNRLTITDGGAKD